MKLNKNIYYKALILSEDIYAESIETLNNLGINIIWSCENHAVSPFLSKHPDMQIVKTGDNTYVCAPECFEYYKKALSKYSVNIICGNTYLSSNYPFDIAYNILVGEKYTVHNFKYTDSILKENLCFKKMIDVSQGYCGCTICSLPSDCFITSDDGVVNALSEYDDVSYLKISHGNVILKGFDYGFFGGATFMIGPKTLAVNGDIKFHPDCDQIIDFCTSKSIDLLSLSQHPLMDIGSGVYID